MAAQVTGPNRPSVETTWGKIVVMALEDDVAARLDAQAVSATEAAAREAADAEQLRILLADAREKLSDAARILSAAGVPQLAVHEYDPPPMGSYVPDVQGVQPARRGRKGRVGPQVGSAWLFEGKAISKQFALTEAGALLLTGRISEKPDAIHVTGDGMGTVSLHPAYVDGRRQLRVGAGEWNGVTVHGVVFDDWLADEVARLVLKARPQQ